jgi:hypothetical protein
MRFLAIRGYVDAYKYAYLSLIAANPLVEMIVFPKGPWREFYFWHLFFASSNLVCWLAYRLGPYTPGKGTGLIATIGFLGERALSIGRIMMCFLGPIGFFPWSPVSGIVWMPLIGLATHMYLIPFVLIALLALIGAEVKYFIDLGKPRFRNP